MKNIAINDFLHYHYPTAIVTSPDGKHGIIPVVNVNEKDNCYDSCLWVMDTATGEYKKLTNGKKERISRLVRMYADQRIEENEIFASATITNVGTTVIPSFAIIPEMK